PRLSPFPHPAPRPPGARAPPAPAQPHTRAPLPRPARQLVPRLRNPPPRPLPPTQPVLAAPAHLAHHPARPRHGRTRNGLARHPDTRRLTGAYLTSSH